MKHTALAQRLVQAGVLMAWLLAYLWLLSDDRYRSYLTPTLRPILLGALVLLALFMVATLWRGRAEPHERLGALFVHGAIMLLPLLYIGAMHGQTLNSYAAAKRALGDSSGPMRMTTMARRLAQRPPGGELTLAEILADLDRQLGHSVSTMGMVLHGDQTPPGHFVLFRFVITCCAADAQPAALLVEYPESDRIPQDTWVRVEGMLGLAKLADGQDGPCLRAARVTPVAPPDNPYLSAF